MKKKIINATSDILSAPKRAYHAKKARKYNRTADLIKKARSYDNAPNFVNGAPTQAYKTRSLAEEAKKNFLKDFNK